jgi:hypothetical protein
MSLPDLDPDLAAALQVLADLGPLQILDIHRISPARRPAPPQTPAPAAAAQPGLFELQEPPAPVLLANPLSPVPSSRRWRPIRRHAGAARSPTPPTWRSHP